MSYVYIYVHICISTSLYICEYKFSRQWFFELLFDEYGDDVCGDGVEPQLLVMLQLTFAPRSLQANSLAVAAAIRL